MNGEIGRCWGLMNMQVQCNKCGGRLEVGEDLVGQQVRCPICEFVVEVTSVAQDTLPQSCEMPQFAAGASAEDSVSEGASSGAEELPVEEVPERDASESADEAPAIGNEWFLKIPEGAEFGPVDLDMMDQWVSQGRVSSDCSLRTEMTSWVSASEHYPELLGAKQSESQRPVGMTAIEPHRGLFVLSLAILGCLVPFFSVWPAVAGTQDLRKMVSGKMDRSGEAMTRSGQAIGMVASIIWIGAFAILLLAVLVRSMSSLTR